MKKMLFCFLAFLVFGYIIFFVFYKININSVHSKIEESKIVEIEKGETLKSIASKLKDEELISSKNLFVFYVKREKKQDKLQAGEYIFEPGLNIRETVEKITKGEVNISEVKVTVLEGWNNNEIGKYLESINLWSKKDWDKALEDYDISKYSFLTKEAKKYNLEGYLFPDTYIIYQESEPEDLITKMLDNFGRKVSEEMRAEIDNQGKSLFEIITMASVIEKEVIMKDNNSDAKVVSGIFWNRISVNQALQSCATLAYILGEAKPVYSTEDTQINSPYNTYRNTGLPIAPISNPGILAIEAAIYPADTDYNYFLSPIGSDETIFSRTYNEHLLNKNKYIK
ncbi:endolytic transglycosylase MltG [bacterium]|nr:endolytic transglycosylase MltG [bacterium]